MKKPLRNALMVAAAVMLVAAGCATTGDGNVERNDGSAMTADEIGMVATGAWGDAVQIAEFYPGVDWQGVEAIEIELPYGETAVLYYFRGLEPGGQVELVMDANIDTFMTNSFIEVGVLPGIYTLEQAVHPRDYLEDFLAFKWIDSVGRFAGEPYPDATDGWERLRSTDFSADENGDVTVMLIINHWTETPPAVYHYITNPTVANYAGE